jgi:hopene-associated glycosyltransferase HpnB
MIFVAAVGLLAWGYLLLLHGRFWQAGPVLLPSPRGAAATGRVAIIVPARDEAENIGAAVRSLLAQDFAGRFEVIVVDDRSTDNTGAIARAAGGDDARLRVIAGAARPAGWSGKLWALAQGVDAAGEADLLLFTDADIIHDPAHLATLAGQLAAGGCDLVSEMVRLSVATSTERALVPAFVYFFQLLYPFAWVNRPEQRTAAAAGGTILVRRQALARIGGIAAMRGALIDDVTLATRIKRGGTIWLGHSALAESLRPYPHASDVWKMIARNAYTQLRHSPWLLAASMMAMALIWVAPPLLTLTAAGPARWIALAAWAAETVSIGPTLRRFRLSPLYALALPAVALFYMAATIGSAVDHLRGRGVAWRGRIYRDGTA